jgi:hypothetical protein
MADVQTSEVDAKFAVVSVGSWHFEYVGLLKVKIHILFCGDNSWTTACSQIKFGTVKDHRYT